MIQLTQCNESIGQRQWKRTAFRGQSPAQEIIVMTEAGMLHRLKKEIPGNRFIPSPTFAPTIHLETRSTLQTD
jgi:quinolinate synthase